MGGGQMDHFWCDPGVRRVSTGETPWGGASGVLQN